MSLARYRLRGARLALGWLLALGALAIACVAWAETRTTTTTTTTTTITDESGALESRIPTTGVPVVVLVGDPNHMQVETGTRLTIVLDDPAGIAGEWVETEVTAGGNLLEQEPGFVWVPNGQSSIDVPLLAKKGATTAGSVNIRARRAESTNDLDWVTETIRVWSTSAPTTSGTIEVHSVVVRPDAIALRYGATLWIVLADRAPVGGQWVQLTYTYEDEDPLENRPTRAWVPGGARYVKVPVNARRIMGGEKGAITIDAMSIGGSVTKSDVLTVI